MILTERRVTRLANELSFASGETKSTILPDSFLVAGIRIYMDGAVTVSGGSSSSSVQSGNHRDFVKSIKIIADGAETIIAWTGKELHEFHRAINGEYLTSTAIANLDTGTKDWEQELYIPFGQLFHRAASPPVTQGGTFLRAGLASWAEVSYLPTWAYDQLELEIEWGTISDFSDGTGDRTETLSLDSLEVYEEYAIPERMKPAQTNPRLYARPETKRKEKVVDATTDDFRLELSRARARSIRALLVWAEDDSVLSNGVINEFWIEADESRKLLTKVSAKAVQARNKRVARMSSAPTTGYYFLDFAEDQNLDDIINTEDWGKLELVMDVTDPGGTVKVHVVEIALQGAT